MSMESEEQDHELKEVILLLGYQVVGGIIGWKSSSWIDVFKYSSLTGNFIPLKFILAGNGSTWTTCWKQKLEMFHKRNEAKYSKPKSVFIIGPSLW